MPWLEVSIVDRRMELVVLAVKEGANVSELARRFGVSRPTAYKWIKRYRESGREGLSDRSRRPLTSPNRSSERIEQMVLDVRRAHPTWGSRLIHGFLRAQGASDLPSPSTVHAILVRHGCIVQEGGQRHKAWRRFEHEAPNDLWQMDYKGHFALREGRCHPLTVLDDHSRYALAVNACGNETAETVLSHLTALFQQYGMPVRMLMDNGGPWGYSRSQIHTQFSVWLMTLGIEVIHGRPRHPQTQGKLERFHRTLKAEAIQGSLFKDLKHAQRAFDRFRHTYNHERPHTALNLDVPATRYHMSPIAFPQTLPTIEYGPDDAVRKVCDKGRIAFKARHFRIGKAFRGKHVAIRPTNEDGLYHVVYCRTRITTIDLNQPVTLNENV